MSADRDARIGTARWPRSPSWASWSSGRATSSWSRARSEILPPIGFSFLRYCIAAITLLILLRWREGAIRLPRGDVVPILLLGVIGFGLLPDPVADRAPDHPGR